MKSSAGLLGVGAAACAACCAGPILGVLGAIGIATAAGYALAGGLALLAGGAAAAWVLHRRQAAGVPEPVEFLASPTTRPRSRPEPNDTDSGGRQRESIPL